MMKGLDTVQIAPEARMSETLELLQMIFHEIPTGSKRKNKRDCYGKKV